ncbi:hypothetical protein SAMN05880545_1073 [Microbacterium sp. RU33B]|nr:hypothetical protein SAMN05880545_1073 [Microbacterium sp. RU33B]
MRRLPSRTPLNPRRTSLRTDPYTARLWRSGSTASWFSHDDYLALASAGAVRMPAWLKMSAEEAKERVYARRLWEDVLCVMAALEQWRTMTVQQIEALTNISGITNGRTSLLTALWVHGLIEVGSPTSDLAASTLDRNMLLLRPARPSAAKKEFEEYLSYAEWVSVTGGRGFSTDRQYARHNLLASEFGLRVAEHGQVSMVLGETLSGMDLLAYTGCGIDAPTTGAQNGADLTLVRTDGLRVAVEMTASKSGSAFNDKVEKLVAILHRRSLEATGLCILFVCAPRQDASRGEAGEVERKVKRAVQRAIVNYPGTALHPTAARVAVARWDRLFPGDGIVADFGSLPMERPTGMRGGTGQIWEPARLLDPRSVPFTPDNPAAMSAVVTNAGGLRGVHHSLRVTGGRPVLADISLAAAGLDWVLDAVEAERPNTGKGAVGPAQLPPRLRY